MYRADIDGLRALAIVPVVLFHMFPEYLPGGFIGVDFFFVISGYLISSIIFSKIENNSFSFSDFYVRRVNRIFPALFLMLTSVLISGWFLLLPVEFAELGKHTASGAGFISNIALFSDVGYFNSAAELKPLLHLWSLGIEEQFYIFWPLILIFAWKKKYDLTKIFLILFLFSFLVNVLRVDRHTDEVFFLLHARFWELLIGCFLTYLERKRNLRDKIIQYRDWFSVVGLSLAFLGFFLLNGERKFPGAWALIPTLSTFLLIAAGPDALINRKLLSHKWLVALGLISYPLYLWHWPLLAFGQITYGESFNAFTKIILIIIAFLLAYFTYRLVEIPIREINQEFKKRLAVVLTSIVFGCGGIGLLAFFEILPPYNNSNAIRNISDAASDWDYPGRLISDKSKKGMRYRVQGTGNKEVVFIGDSNIEQYYPRVERLLERNSNFKIVFLAHGGCPPIRNIRDNRDSTDSCPTHVENSIKEALRPEVHSVVLGASWYSYFKKDTKYYIENNISKTIASQTNGFDGAMDELKNTLKILKHSNKKVYLVLNMPMGKVYDPKQMVERSFSSTPVKIHIEPLIKVEFDEKYAEVKKALIEVAMSADVIIIDPIDHLCLKDICPTATQDGKPFYKDESHFRPYYAKEHVKYLDRVFE